MKKIFFTVLFVSLLGIKSLPARDSTKESQDMEKNFEALAKLEHVVPKMNGIISYVEKKLKEYGYHPTLFEGVPLESDLKDAVSNRETAGNKLIEIEDRERYLINKASCPRNSDKQYVLGMASRFAIELQKADKRMWDIIERTDMVDSMTESYKRRSQAQINFFKYLIAKAKECRLLEKE